MTMTNTPLDFEKVELVRERMGLTIKDMCQLLDVTRVTYYKWVDGGALRDRNDRRVRYLLRQLLPLLKDGSWPPEGAKFQTSPARLRSLLEILEVVE
jgi:DNA-binding XRE family transcriptional regulator